MQRTCAEVSQQTTLVRGSCSAIASSWRRSRCAWRPDNPGATTKHVGRCFVPGAQVVQQGDGLAGVGEEPHRPEPADLLPEADEVDLLQARPASGGQLDDEVGDGEADGDRRTVEGERPSRQQIEEAADPPSSHNVTSPASAGVAARRPSPVRARRTESMTVALRGTTHVAPSGPGREGRRGAAPGFAKGAGVIRAEEPRERHLVREQRPRRQLDEQPAPFGLLEVARGQRPGRDGLFGRRRSVVPLVGSLEVPRHLNSQLETSLATRRAVPSWTQGTETGWSLPECSRRGHSGRGFPRGHKSPLSRWPWRRNRRQGHGQMIGARFTGSPTGRRSRYPLRVHRSWRLCTHRQRDQVPAVSGRAALP